MSSGLYSGVSGLALGVGLSRDVSGLWSGSPGFARGGGSFPPPVGPTYLPTTATAPIGVWSLYKLIEAHSGPVAQACATGAANTPASTVDITSNPDGSPNLDAAVAAFGSSFHLYVIYDQSGNGYDMTHATAATRMNLLVANAQNGKQGWTILTTSQFSTIPDAMATARANVTMVTVQGVAYGQALFSLGNSATSTNDLTIINDTRRVQGLGSTFQYGAYYAPQQPAVVVVQSGAANLKVRVNEGLSTLTAQTALALAGGRVGKIGAAVTHSGIWGDHYAKVVYPASLSDGDAGAVRDALYTVFGVENGLLNQVVCSGDSLMFGQGASGGRGHTRQMIPNLSVPAYVNNVGVSGQLLSTIYTGRSDYQSAYRSNYAHNIFLCNGGTNDLAANSATVGYGATLWTSQMLPLIQSMVAAGWDVVIETIIPRSTFTGGSTVETNRLAYNQLIRDNAATYGYYVADCAAGFTFADTSDVAIYTDGTHLTEAGYAIKEAAVREQVNIILTSVPRMRTMPSVLGHPFVSERLTAYTGRWIGSPTDYAIQWTRNGAAIVGEIGDTYDQTASDEGTEVSFDIIQFNEYGPSATVSAAPTSPVRPASNLFLIDRFTDTDNTAITSHTPDMGSAWALVFGMTPATPSRIAANRLYATHSSDVYRNTVTPPSADYAVEAQIDYLSTVASDNVGISGRCATGVNDQYRWRYSRTSNSWGLFKIVAGTATQLGSNYSDTFVAGSRMARLVMDGDQISGVLDGVTVVGPITDTSITGAGQPGVVTSLAVTSTTGMHNNSIVAFEIPALTPPVDEGWTLYSDTDPVDTTISSGTIGDLVTNLTGADLFEKIRNDSRISVASDGTISTNLPIYSNAPARFVARATNTATTEYIQIALEIPGDETTTTRLLDFFTDTDGTQIPAHQPEIGGVWRNVVGTSGASDQITSGNLWSLSALRAHYNDVTMESANYYVEGEMVYLSSASGSYGVAGRISPAAQTMYLLRHSTAANAWGLFKIVAGTATQLGSNYSDTFTSGTRTVRLVMNGNQISGMVGGATVIGPVTDSSITAAGHPGVRILLASATPAGIGISKIEATLL